jgi:hypothetical protein
MLPTDWFAPSTAVLRRVYDQRAAQFWDEEHLFARRLAADARAPQPEFECCEASGIPWDLVAVYPKDVRWGARLPPAVFINGPVIKFESQLQATLQTLLR